MKKKTNRYKFFETFDFTKPHPEHTDAFLTALAFGITKRPLSAAQWHKLRDEMTADERRVLDLK